ncbi:hypothetical protein B6I21_08225 [candidate division KSB1 bacterium 4572_119]|nr:MAG: hypothetical protein B6I21_08225 [candidate division KSB1 bacterium 4572_119]
MRDRRLCRSRLTKFILFIILMLSTVSFARETPQVEGIIIDNITKSPIANVNIYFNSLGKGTISDSSGYFFLQNVPEGKQELIVNHIGYKKKRIQVEIQKGNKNKLHIQLSPRAISLNEIIFTANRRNENIFKSQNDVAVATTEKISIRTSPNTADALRELPGVLVQKTTAGHGSPIIRGMIGKNVLLLYNGIRLNKPTFRFGANQYMNTINVELLERIEVIKGPSSVMYGSDAIGGVVNMIPSSLDSDDASDMPFSSSFSSRYGSADQSIILNGMLFKKFNNITFAGFIAKKNFGDLKAGGEIGEQKPTGYKELDGDFRIGIKLNQDTYLDLDLMAVNQEEVPRYDKYVTGKYETYIYDPQNRYLAGLTLRSNLNSTSWLSSFKLNLSAQFEEEGTTLVKSGNEAITKNRNVLTTLGSYLQINSIFRSRNVISWGYEFYVDKINSNRVREENGFSENIRPSFPNGSVYSSTGLFLNDHFIMNQKTDLTIGLRWSHFTISTPFDVDFGDFDDRYGEFTGSVGFSYRPLNWLNFVGTYAKGFRAPNFNDTIVLKVSNAGVDAPSPGLSPEKSHNFEAGIKINHDKLYGSFFMFYNKLVDLIDRYKGSFNGLSFYDENGNGIRDEDEVDIYQKRNAAKAYIAGWEFSTIFKISDMWSLTGFVFWTFGQNQTFNEPMSRIPPLMGMGSIRCKPKENLKFDLFFRAATKQHRLSTRDMDDSRIPEGGTPGWKTLNLRSSINIRSHFVFNFILENILDETYKEHGSGVYSPGRGFVVGIKYQN